MSTLREYFWRTEDQMVRHRQGGYEEWLEGEVAWYRDWADRLAQALCTTELEELTVLTRYQDERNRKDFD